jgi:Transposase DDE domain group 1
MTACILLAWLKLTALDGDLARAEPKTLRYRLLHAAARLFRGGRRRTLKIAATWPWADEIVIAWQRIPGHSVPALTSRNRPGNQERSHPGAVEPRLPGATAGPAKAP